MPHHCFIGDCDSCPSRDVPVARGVGGGAEGLFCFPCRGDVRDPYGIEDEPERAADGNSYRYHATGLPVGGNAL